MRKRFGEPPDILGDTANGTPDEDRRDLQKFLNSVRTKGELCRHVISLGDLNLVVATFDESHTASHRYWRYRPESANGVEADDTLRNAIRSAHQAVDRELGLLSSTSVKEPTSSCSASSACRTSSRRRR